MTVLLSFEEKTGDARACAQSGHCPFNWFSPFSDCIKEGLTVTDTVKFIALLKRLCTL